MTSLGVLRVVLTLCLALGSALPCAASGAWAPEAVFETASTPEPGRITRFLAGEIGVFRREYALLYAWAVQRSLLGKPLTPSEIALARAAQLGTTGEQDGFGLWRQRRAAFAAATSGAAAPDLEVYGTLQGPDADRAFLNCQDDAFLTAAKRLDTHSARGDDDGVWLSDWVRAQDAVFGNCAIVDGVDPLPAPDGAPGWLQQDRAYQRAAALLYRGESQRAADAFAAIAKDSQSPWQATAAYLVARVWMREALHFAPDGEARAAALSRAHDAVVDALAATEDPPTRAALGRLQRRIALSIDPVAAFSAATRRLDSGIAGDDFLQDLDEVLFLRDDVPAEAAARSWLLSVRAPPSLDDFEQAFARWQETRSADWLLAALLHAPAGDARTAGLLAAVDALPVTTPGKWTLDFERARLLLARGDRAAAALLTELAPRPNLAVSDRGALARLRFLAADSLATALPFAQSESLGVVFENERDLWPTWRPLPEVDARVPAAVKPRLATADDEEPFDLVAWQDNSWPALAALRGKPLLYPDAAAVLGRWLPAEQLAAIALAQGSPLGEQVRGQLADVAWVRAWLLGRAELLAQLTPLLATRHPAQRELLAQSVAVAPARQGAVSAAEFRGALLLLRLPGLSPVLHGGVGRALDAEEIGQLALWRWWGAGENEFSDEQLVERPGWIDKAVAQAADAERDKLAILAASTTTLASVVLRYAAVAPRDPLLPEALHYVVRATRYGAPDADASQRAFTLLHRGYPRSLWAKRTPYHY